MAEFNCMMDDGTKLEVVPSAREMGFNIPKNPDNQTLVFLSLADCKKLKKLLKKHIEAHAA